MGTNSTKYKREYNKNNYIEKKARFKPDFWLKIDDYCKYSGLSYNEFFNNAAKYILDEKIDIKGYK